MAAPAGAPVFFDPAMVLAAGRAEIQDPNVNYREAALLLQDDRIHRVFAYNGRNLTSEEITAELNHKKAHAELYKNAPWYTSWWPCNGLPSKTNLADYVIFCANVTTHIHTNFGLMALVASTKIGQLQRNLENKTAEAARLTQEKNDLTLNLAARTNERDVARGERDVRQGALDAANAARNNLEQERNGLQANLQNVTGERNAAQQLLAATTVQRDGLQANLNAVTAEHDALQENLQIKTDQHEALQGHHDIQKKQLQGLRSELKIFKGLLLAVMLVIIGWILTPFTSRRT